MKALRSVLATASGLQRQQAHIGFGQQHQALALAQTFPALDFLAAAAAAQADVPFELTDLGAGIFAH